MFGAGGGRLQCDSFYRDHLLDKVDHILVAAVVAKKLMVDDIIMIKACVKQICLLGVSFE